MSHSLNANGMNGSSSPAGIREGTRVVLKEITSTMHNSPPTTHRVCRKSSSNSPIVKGEHEVKVQFTREFVDVGPPPSRPESPASTSSFQSLASTLSAKSCVEPPDTPQKIADTSYTNKDICDLDDLISACGNIKLNDQSQVSGNTLLDSTLTITACDESFSHAGGPEDQTGETFVSALGNLSADKEFQEPTSQHTEISPNAVDSNVTQTFTSQSESNHESGRITDSSFTEISNNCNTSNENSSHALHTSVENIPFVQSNESTSQCNRSWNHISESKEGAPVSNPTINRSLPTLNRTSEFDPVKPALSLNTTENSSLNCSQEPQNIQTGTTDKLNLTQDIWKTENDETKNTIPEDINSKLNETRELSATEITVNSSTTVESHSELIGHDKAILPSDIEITAPTIISPTRIPCSGKSPIQESRSPIDSKVVSASEDVQKSEVSPIIVAEKLSKEVVSDNSEIVKLPTSKETVPIVSTVPILQTRTVDSQVSEQIVPEQKISQCPTSPNRSQSELPIGQKQELSKNIEPFSLTDSTGSETLNASEESTLTHSNIETDSRVVLQSSGNAVRENPVGGDPNSVVENINVSQRHSPAANGTRTEGFTINEENRNEEITTDISQLIPPAVNTVPVHCSNHRVPENPATCTPNKMDEPPKIEELVAEVKQEFIPIVDPNMVKELELVRSTVVELENQIENQKKEFQQELDKQKAKYETELAHKAQDNEKLALVIDEYEKSISRLVADRGRESVSLEQETAKLQEELQTTNHHLNNTEAAFNDVHLKYERLKGVVAAYKSNESVLKDSIQENVATIKQLEARYDQLKSHAMAQLEKANLELDTLRKQNESETVKLQAMIRKAELKSNSLAEIVEQKIKENKQLTEILDEVIARVGHKSDD